MPVVNFASNYTSTGLDPNSLDFSTGTGELVALNASTGTQIWKKEYPSMTLGEATRKPVLFSMSLPRPGE